MNGTLLSGSQKKKERKKFSYLLIAKPCEHLARTRYSHQTLQEILEYFRLCKWRAAEEAQTVLGTAQLFHGPHLVATDTCTPVTPPELRGEMTSG